MRPRLGGLLAAVALLTAGSLLFAPGGAGGSAQAATRGRDAAVAPSPGAAAPSEISLPLTLAGPSTPIAMRPVGLSLEYSTMAQDLGTGTCPPPALTAELRRLGSPPLGLAGRGQDLK